MSPEKKTKFLKYSIASFLSLLLVLLLSYGTIFPCEIVKKQLARQLLEDKSLNENPFAVLGIGMIDKVVEAMSPPKCAYAALRMAFNFNGNNTSSKSGKNDGETSSKNPYIPSRDLKNSGEPVPAEKLFGATKPDEVNEQNSAKTAYMDKIDLYDFKAKYFETYSDEKSPGVDFKIKNKGDRTLSKIEVTVYFKSADGTTIAEENYFPVSMSSDSIGGDNKPLKPNYIWQQERGHFYTAKKVPSEWKEGEASAKITNIEFLEEKK